MTMAQKLYFTLLLLFATSDWILKGNLALDCHLAYCPASCFPINELVVIGVFPHVSGDNQ